MKRKSEMPDQKKGKQQKKGMIHRGCRMLSLLLALLLVLSGAYPAVRSHSAEGQTVLICTREEHRHDTSCYEEERILTCTQNEREGHIHNDSCYQRQDVLQCGLEESEAHTHGPECYSTEEILVCGQEETAGHRHGDGCYQSTQRLVCTKQEHVHGPECYGTVEQRENQDRTDSSEIIKQDEAEGQEEGFGIQETEILIDEESTEAPEIGQTEESGLIEAITEETESESESEQYSYFLEELEKWKESGVNEENWIEAQHLLNQIEEAFEAGMLTEEEYLELKEVLLALLEEYYYTMAEAAEGTNWEQLRDSGWFEAYCGSVDTGAENAAEVQSLSVDEIAAGMQIAVLDESGDAAAEGDVVRASGAKPSGVQVVKGGGGNESDDQKVAVSKTIAGTDLENVFDITLTVRTTENISEIYEDPDMAVVIVMDISNTMTSDFGGVTRYKAAMDAAEQFLDRFAENTKSGVSKIGYVAFNTNAYQIFGLQSCSTQEEADKLKNKMRSETGKIINAEGYDGDHSRFTNIEAGLQRGQDMLAGNSNQNKYIIFLSDGFPTTYISSGYSGYDPYDSTGTYFYDGVLNKKCLYGTSYSDKAAIQARKKAEQIKTSGIRIFSIGVDVGGQTIQKYITQSENSVGFSVVDRTGTSYEIGDASSTNSYKDWLKNRIGSGYYYDSTNSAGLQAAYDQIFQEIRRLIGERAEAQWVAKDPMPTSGNAAGMVEFIGFYDKTNTLTKNDLTGTWEEGKENTVRFSGETQTIQWNLKKSGYQKTGSGNALVYTYQVVYRVRLKNEAQSFIENKTYQTNNPTSLTYQIVQNNNGSITISDPKTLEFPIPSVKGYLAELSFQKQDNYGRPVAGAEFTLRHDTRNCPVCHGDNTSTAISDQTVISGADGVVSFSDIPSGHQYSLEETKVPDGYYANDNHYKVTVAYDVLTVDVTDSGGNSQMPLGEDGKPLPWDRVIVNSTEYRLPETGGIGTRPYTMGGLLLLALAGCSLLYNKKQRKDGR